MGLKSITSGNEPPESPPKKRRAAADDCQFDRRAIIRGTGAVLLASSLAGCYHNGGDDGDDGGYGGDYSIDKSPTSKG